MTIQELNEKFIRQNEAACPRRWAVLEAIRERLGFPDFFDAREAEARCLTFLEASQNLVKAETRQHAAVVAARELLAENERLKARIATLEGGAARPEEVAK